MARVNLLRVAGFGEQLVEQAKVVELVLRLGKARNVHPAKRLANVLFLIWDEHVLSRQRQPKRGDLRGKDVAVSAEILARRIAAGDDQPRGEAVLFQQIAQELRSGDLSAAMEPEDDVNGRLVIPPVARIVPGED